MSYTSERLSVHELLNIMTLSDNAMAIYTTEDAIIETANDKMLSFWNKDRSVIGKPLADAVPELKGQPFLEILKNVWRTGITYHAKDTPANLEAEGSLQTFYFNFEYRAITKSDGTMYCILHTATDVTKTVIQNEINRKNAKQLQHTNEELTAYNKGVFDANAELRQVQGNLQTLYVSLAESEIKFRTLIEQIPVAINIFRGRDLVIELANVRMLEIWGRTANVIGKPLLAAMPELMGQPFMKRLDDVLTTGIAYYSNDERAFILRDGELQECYFNIVYQPIVDSGGTITSILQIASEVTGQILANKQIQNLNEELAAANEELAATNKELAAGNEELRSLNKEMQMIQNDLQNTNNKLKESEERFSAITNSEDIYIGVVNGQGIPIYANEAFRRLTGRSHDEFTEKGYADLLHPADRETYMAAFMKAFAARKDFKGEYRMRNTTGEYRLLTSNVLPLFNADGSFTGYISTSIDITERKQYQEKLQELNEELAASNEELRSVNEEMQVIYDNMISANIQLAESEERFRNMAEGTSVMIAVGDESSNAVYFNKAWENITGRDQTELLRFGWVDLVHPEDKERYVNTYLSAFAKQTPFTGEFRIRNKEGNYRCLLAQGLPRFRNDQSFAGYISSCVDITEQKRDDERKNDFIGMVSHELKTPLTSLSGYLELVQMDLKKENDTRNSSLLEKAGKQVSKMTTMINGFLNVSRLESGKLQIDRQRFDMAKLVKQSEEEVLAMFGSHNIIYAPVEETFVMADRDKIDHVINNFISNAVKYSPLKSTINVACITVNGMAQVSVKDEGMGIALSDQEKLFERYYRVTNNSTRSVSGFGIGLYLCAEIIRHHEGRIWVESEPGKGSVFYFSLPVAK